jgi:hypothetical protein
MNSRNDGIAVASASFDSASASMRIVVYHERSTTKAARARASAGSPEAGQAASGSRGALDVGDAKQRRDPKVYRLETLFDDRTNCCDGMCG